MVKISVITAVFNRQDSIALALESLFSQTYGNIDSIVIDGLSTDKTVEKIENFRDRLGAFRSERDGGIYEALNKGINLASGDVIGILHSDDFFADDQVLSDVANIFSDPKIDAVYGDLDYVIAHGSAIEVFRRWRSGPYDSKKLYRGWMPPHPTLFVRRRVFETLGRYDENFRISADYDFILRLLRSGNIKMVYLPRVLVKMRVGGASNKSIRNIMKKSREDFKVLRNNNFGLTASLRALFWKNIRKINQFF
jgi:glycosyltransferase involved in cell wall biosynthesis